MQADANQGALTHISTPSIACVFLFYGNTQEHVIFYYPLQLDLSCIMAFFFFPEGERVISQHTADKSFIVSKTPLLYEKQKRKEFHIS
jgi:hypothetical protein